MLNTALQDPHFVATRTSVETVALQTGHPIVHDSYLQALESQAQPMSTGQLQHMNARATRRHRIVVREVVVFTQVVAMEEAVVTTEGEMQEVNGRKI